MQRTRSQNSSRHTSRNIIHVICPRSTDVPVGRCCTFSRIHGRWTSPWRNIWNGHERRIPRASRRAHHKAQQQPCGGVMIVNTELGAFDNGRVVLPLMPFNNKVERESINPHFRAYEKFISGMYLGEITRDPLFMLKVPQPVLFASRGAGDGP
ncbi:hypothetical protein EDB87DRAFT_569351 [Lactarius vividus]|nr:hypothetical protein EDB87DRAFT_569351 [Lactarius vividus]